MGYSPPLEGCPKGGVVVGGSKANDRRNVLAADRLHYDVLNHTDLSREGGQSGDIDLSHINWGNYDLVVIDDRLHGIEHHGSVRFAAIGRAYGTHA